MPCLLQISYLRESAFLEAFQLCGISYAELNLIFSICWVEVWYDSYARHMYVRTYSKLIVKSVLNRLWNLIGRITYFLKFKSQKAKMTENFSAKIWYLESIFKLIYVLWCSNIGYHICYMIYYMRHKLCHFIHQ